MSVAELTTDPAYSLGERIRRARLEASLQQQELATLVGVSRPQVSKWERNISIPDLLESVKIAEYTKKSLGWLAGADPIIRWSSDAPVLTCVDGTRAPQLPLAPVGRVLFLVPALPT